MVYESIAPNCFSTILDSKRRSITNPPSKERDSRKVVGSGASITASLLSRFTELPVLEKCMTHTPPISPCKPRALKTTAPPLIVEKLEWHSPSLSSVAITPFHKNTFYLTLENHQQSSRSRRKTLKISEFCFLGLWWRGILLDPHVLLQRCFRNVDLEEFWASIRHLVQISSQTGNGNFMLSKRFGHQVSSYFP